MFLHAWTGGSNTVKNTDVILQKPEAQASTDTFEM
jgi:hypothetical protein